MADRKANRDDDYYVINETRMSLNPSPLGLLMPGIDQTTNREAARLCARDYLENHAFYNDKQFHNHLNHQLLAVYSLGGSVKRLQEIFDINNSYQRPFPARVSDVTITSKNYTEYLSKEEYYANFLEFYCKELHMSDGNWNAVVAKYFFDPQIFPLAMSGLLHPFIQLGYGLEFKSEAIIAMALAQASIHKKQFSCAFDTETFDEICSQADKNDAAGLSFFDIFGRMHGDPIAAKITYNEEPYAKENHDHAEDLAIKYAKLWTVEHTEDSVKTKCMEIMTVIALVYGSSNRYGYRKVLEFGIMHNLTSSYFLPIYMDALTLDNKVRLLHAYAVTFLYMFASKGCPPLNIPPELTSTNTHGAEISESLGDNPWTYVIDRAIASNDMHVAKVVRALWRLSLLSAFPSQDEYADRYAARPINANCLYLAFITIGNISKSVRRNPDTGKMELKDEEGDQGWAHGMFAFDEFWANKPTGP
ncbi:hypothetical protein H4S07_001922 [Coemansia furcata]|uniref:Uncharacterized protein n=1 Tax=Coemansia furcata TaxID=417177 RepID=A0ACC1LMX6_9FUNG|nr:hypothetical protein H4S07_001922 [Coemansia furcata]